MVWERKTLGEVCNINSGNPAPQKKESFEEGIYPFFRTSDVGKIHLGIIYDSKDKLNENGIKGLTLYKKGTLLFPKSGASTFLNHRVILGRDGYVSSHLATIKAKRDILDDKFLFYLSINIDARDLMQDQNYPSLRLSDIQNINILVPSIQEQRQIVKIIEESFEKIAKAKENAEKNLKNAKEIFEGYLQNVFKNKSKDWETKKIDDVCYVEYGTRVVQKRDGGTIYPVYGGGGATFFMDKPNREDCLVIARFGMSENCTRFIKGKFFLNDSGLSITPKDKERLSQEFLNYEIFYLNDDIYSLGKGTAQKNLDVPSFRNMNISFPNSLIEQQLLVKKLNSLSSETKKLEEIYQQKLEDLEELKNSILQKAFNGELIK